MIIFTNIFSYCYYVYIINKRCWDIIANNIKTIFEFLLFLRKINIQCICICFKNRLRNFNCIFYLRIKKPWSLMSRIYSWDLTAYFVIL